MLNFVFIFVIVASVLEHGTALELHDECPTPDGNDGECVLIKDCKPIRSLLQKPRPTPHDVQFVQNSKCGKLDGRFLVCCALSVNITTNLSLLPEPGSCGDQSADRIHGGTRAAIDEFPWLALIQQRLKNGSLVFGCGGSLISDRYVVSAAHCTDSQEITLVRLGEWDISSNIDCISQQGERLCAPPVIDIKVQNTIVHADYDPTIAKHDISLLRLEEAVEFTDYVKPICLPIENSERNKDLRKNKLMVAGWGETENNVPSQFKLKVSLNVVSQADCQEAFPMHSIDDKQICAGGKKGEDSCNGDSGGPLMDVAQSKSRIFYYIAGIISFGPKKCGQDGRPAVYTKVGAYVDWILTNIRA